jgi:hypothetical protein
MIYTNAAGQQAEALALLEVDGPAFDDGAGSYREAVGYALVAPDGMGDVACYTDNMGRVAEAAGAVFVDGPYSDEAGALQDPIPAFHIEDDARVYQDAMGRWLDALVICDLTP